MRRHPSHYLSPARANARQGKTPKPRPGKRPAGQDPEAGRSRSKSPQQCSEQTRKPVNSEQDSCSLDRRFNEDADLAQVWAQVGPLAQRALTAIAALDERAVRTGNKQLVADHVAAKWPLHAKHRCSSGMPTSAWTLCREMMFLPPPRPTSGYRPSQRLGFCGIGITRLIVSID